MKKTLLSLILSAIFFSFLLAGCKKHHSPKSDNPYGLPNATQEGKNTLGFLLNGESWTPRGFNGTANLDLYYDETFQNGVFNLSAYRNLLDTNGKRQSLVMFGDSIQIPNKIILPESNKFGFTFWDESNNCTYNSNDSTTQILDGYFHIQKLDKINHIFSGQFEFHFVKDNYPDMHITSGRFDMKY